MADTEYEKRVEGRARVLWENFEHRYDTKWSDVFEGVKMKWRKLARATMESDREAGYALVPKEANLAMLSAGQKPLKSYGYVSEIINAALAAGDVLKG